MLLFTDWLARALSIRPTFFLCRSGYYKHAFGKSGRASESHHFHMSLSCSAAATMPWNKGLVIGQKSAFTPSQIQQIDHWLESTDQLHDRCLFRIGIDSSLRAVDLLRLRPCDIELTYPRGPAIIKTRQKKTGLNVFPVLTPSTYSICKKWIATSGKTARYPLFTRHKDYDSSAICTSTYRRLVKYWAEAIGLDGSKHSTHSIRRSKPAFLFTQNVKPERIAQLLGHRSTESLLHYLGLTMAAAQAEALTHDIFKPKDLTKNRKSRS